MRLLISSIFVLMMSVLVAGCSGGEGTGKGTSAGSKQAASISKIKTITIDYPVGGQRLHIEDNGRARLFYGEGTTSRKIAMGTFTADGIYSELKERLHEKTDKENWADPEATAGVVKIHYMDTGVIEYNIFNEDEYVNALYAKAKKNFIWNTPDRQQK
ncbi:MAG: hypothetical protein KAR06_05425 [Deltaproteobacteria bacterium]|nr:hypothetical protein [Deltaproteobacteria bacterium]